MHSSQRTRSSGRASRSTTSFTTGTAASLRENWSRPRALNTAPTPASPPATGCVIAITSVLLGTTMP